MKAMRKIFAVLIGTATTMLYLTSAATAQEKASHILFENVNVFDGVSETLSTNTKVLIENNLIKDVGPTASAPAGTQVIDGGGRTLMPGMINSHVHFNLTGLFHTLAGGQAAKWSQIGAQAAANARDQLMDGFTTVRDTCGMDNGLQKLVDAGALVGPRIYVSGACISPSSGHGDWRAPNQRTPLAAPSWLEQLGIIEVVDGPDAIRSASRRNFSNGAHFLKLMAGGGVSSELDPLWSHAYNQMELEAAVEAAEFFDTYVMVHAYTDRSIRAAINAGVKVVDHGQMASEEAVKLMAEKGIFWVNNMAGLDPDLLTHPNYASGPVRPKVEFYHEGSKNMIEYIKKHKPKIAFGVDTVLSTMHQGRAHRDFEKHIFSKWLGNHALLVALTSTPGELARLTGKRNPYPDAKLGVIEKGAYADILIVDGNPLEDVSVLGANEKWFDAEPRDESHETIRIIMKDGRIYKNTL
jgi:imidazolonepropionase-like amidohydrolase